MTLPLHGFPDWQRSLATADLQAFFNTQSVASLVTKVFGPFDMRSYSSFAINVQANIPGTGTGRSRVDITASWYDDAAFTHKVYEEPYLIFPSVGIVSAATNNQFGGFYLQDVVHGPFLVVQVVNDGADTFNLTTEVLGNSRSIPRRYVRGNVDAGPVDTTTQGVQLIDLTTTVNNGVNIDVYMPLAVGPAHVEIFNGAAAVVNYTFVTPDAKVPYATSQPANGFVDTKINLPNSACLLNINNIGAAPNTVQVHVVSDGAWM